MSNPKTSLSSYYPNHAFIWNYSRQGVGGRICDRIWIYTDMLVMSPISVTRIDSQKEHQFLLLMSKPRISPSFSCPNLEATFLFVQPGQSDYRLHHPSNIQASPVHYTAHGIRLRSTNSKC